MRIAVDCTCWANGRGYGRYTREIVSALVADAPGHEFICLLDERAAGAFTLSHPAVRPVVVGQAVSPTLAAATGRRRSVADMLRLTGAVKRQAPDVFYSPAVYGYFPLPPRLPAVVTVHDAIAERFPAWTLPSLPDRLAWRAKVRLALMQCRGVLTVSEYAARQIQMYLRVPRARMRVTLEAASDDFHPSESSEVIAGAAREVGLPDGARWLMYVGGFGPHKHVDLVVRAHADVARRRPGARLHLVLAGPGGDGFHDDVAHIRRTIREAGLEQLVHWAGYLPDETLRHLHSGAVALLLVSASEGFGLPAIEAARCGTPVIATTESPLPDLLDGGGIFVPPGSMPPIAAAIERLLDDEPARKAMGARARARAQALTWRSAARVAREALEDAASAAPRVGSDVRG